MYPLIKKLLLKILLAFASTTGEIKNTFFYNFIILIRVRSRVGDYKKTEPYSWKGNSTADLLIFWFNSSIKSLFHFKRLTCQHPRQNVIPGTD